MSKVKITNNQLHIINILLKEGSSNKNTQLLSKESVIVNNDTLTDQVKRLRDLSILSVVPYTETIIV